MFFFVSMTVRIPHGTNQDLVKQLAAQEHARAIELESQEKWLHVWRVVGKWANVSIFKVDSPAELHEILNSLPLYLIQRIEESRRIQIHYSSELASLEGVDHLEQVTWTNKETKKTIAKPIRHIFVMAGASPKTEWLAGCTSLDSKGFVLTGRDIETKEPPIPWPLKRRPHMLESSLPAVFAVGDARSGNVKRVASAVGEGSMVLNFIHDALAES
jgi:muconolactone delta-isomerase